MIVIMLARIIIKMLVRMPARIIIKMIVRMIIILLVKMVNFVQLGFSSKGVMTDKKFSTILIY